MADVDVTDHTALDDGSTQLKAVADAFARAMETTAHSSASPQATGSMPEGIAFMKNERQARELLVQYLSKTSDGLQGYQSAVQQIRDQYGNLVAVNKQRLQALLQPHDGPVPNSPVFDWHQALQYQTENPGGDWK
jgi:hypothetical protein